ncbi:hypothetical protein PybrP1_006977 [[Pythium] brassicae (nom. inval.)]|nr:hypothetical protein PybrP1_006977 [[Pythium] brassicae (nom. inval.)]
MTSAMVSSMTWATIKTMMAAIQDVALQQGKRALYLVCECWKTRHKQKEPLWHVTPCSLEHINCIGIAKPTTRQITENSVLRASVVADNAAAAATLTQQLRLQTGVVCSAPLVRRAKEDVLREVFSEDTRSIGLLPSFLRELSEVDTGLTTELYQDGDGCFDQAVIVMNPELFTNGQQVFGINAAHIKHWQYNDVQIVFVAQDGNFENRTAAIALASKESASSYAWFFGVLLDVGFQLCSVPVFCDHHVGFVAAAESLGVRVRFGTRHIIEFGHTLLTYAVYIRNMRGDRTVRLTVVQDAVAW